MLLVNNQICQEFASKIIIPRLEQYACQNEHTVFYLTYSMLKKYCTSKNMSIYAFR